MEKVNFIGCFKPAVATLAVLLIVIGSQNSAARNHLLVPVTMQDDPISGMWDGDLTRDRPDFMGVKTSKGRFLFDLKLEEKKVSGVAFIEMYPIAKGSWLDQKLQLEIDDGAYDEHCKIIGRIDDGHLVGSVRCTGADDYNATFDAKKRRP